MRNGIVDANEEVTIAAEAGGRSPSDMRNEMPRFLRKIMAGDTRIRGMLIITSDVILQGIKQGVFTVQRVTNSNVTDDTLFSEMKKFESKRADADTAEHQEEDQESEE